MFVHEKREYEVKREMEADRKVVEEIYKRCSASEKKSDRIAALVTLKEAIGKSEKSGWSLCFDRRQKCGNCQGIDARRRSSIAVANKD